MNDLYKNILNQVKEEHKSSMNRSRNSRVLVVDSLNAFIRSWTTNPQMDDNGNHIGGITGFLKSIGYIIREIKPTRVILVFDGKRGSADRKKIYEGYKSDRGNIRFRVNRQYEGLMTEMEEHESMKRQLIQLVECLNYLPVTTMIYDGVEADDVIAYIVTNLIKTDEQCVIMSTDKDFMQLVSPNTIIYSPTKKVTYNRHKISDEYGIYPQNFAIFRSLDGDTSDNVPGVKGCGLKTLIKRFPELKEDRLITPDEFIELCETKGKTEKYKIYSDIIQNKDIFYRNYKIMQLSNVDIATDFKLKIINRYEETITPLDTFSFMKIMAKYKLSNGWDNILVWAKDTFSGVVHE